MRRTERPPEMWIVTIYGAVASRMGARYCSSCVSRKTACITSEMRGEQYSAAASLAEGRYTADRKKSMPASKSL